MLAATAGGDDKNVGDPLRAATGIRPSLHPTAINAIANALKLRAKGELLVVNQDDDDSSSSNNNALELAIQAGQIATDVIAQRQQSAKQDGMTLTKEEEQTLAGRVVGVIMRFYELEKLLVEKTSTQTWITKYNEWDTFGVMAEEAEEEQEKQNSNDTTTTTLLQNRIKDDPLFTLNRAECLLGLFLHTIEIPQLIKIGQEVPDKSIIDFLDEDRKDVLLN